MEEESKNLYIVEKIIASKILYRQKLYLIKWKNYPLSNSTWEPKNNLKDISDLVEDFEKGFPETVDKKMLKDFKNLNKVNKKRKNLKTIHRSQRKKNLNKNRILETTKVKIPFSVFYPEDTQDNVNLINETFDDSNINNVIIDINNIENKEKTKEINDRIIICNSLVESESYMLQRKLKIPLKGKENINENLKEKLIFPIVIGVKF